MSTQVTQSIIVNGDVEDVYDTWQDFTKHPHFRDYVTAVTDKGHGTYHWEMTGPLDTRLEWTIELTRRDQYKRLGWKTVDGDLKTSGQAVFTPLPADQVEVTVTAQTVPPEKLTHTEMSKLFENEAEQLQKDLRHFKAYIEGRAN